MYRCLARAQKIPILLIGHITKSGDFAGPKAIEHLVDVALEVRRVRKLRERLTEAAKLGYKRAVVPAGEKPEAAGLELCAVRTLREAMEALGL